MATKRRIGKEKLYVPKDEYITKPLRSNLDEQHLEGQIDVTYPSAKQKDIDNQEMLNSLRLAEEKKIATEKSIADHQYDKGAWVDTRERSVNRSYRMAPSIIPMKDNTDRKLGPEQEDVSGVEGDYAPNVSYESLYLGGQLATQANRLKRALLYNEDIDLAGKEVSFKRFNQIVEARAREALRLQLEKAERDELIMELQQKHLMLNRNAMFQDMYFTKSVFDRS